MSRFLSEKLKSLKPYVPGEQPQDMKYLKLNTNESPFPPSPRVKSAIVEATEKLRLYPDPENSVLTSALAEFYGVDKGDVFVGNGSDEVLAFAFYAFFDAEKPACYTDITYGFYPVYCDLYGIRGKEIPLFDDYTVDVDALIAADEGVVIANPNAQTGIALSRKEVERLIASKSDRLVIVDEAYVDFGTESVVSLTKEYDNLLVIGTFSKSRQLAGARLGYAIGNARLIDDLKTVKNCFNSYNVNRLTEAAATASLQDKEYFYEHTSLIEKNRAWTTDRLCEMGFTVLPSRANFVLASTDRMSGKELYLRLKEQGVLVRHFDKPRLDNFVRITIGTAEQMRVFVKKTEDIIKGE